MPPSIGQKLGRTQFVMPKDLDNKRVQRRPNSSNQKFIIKTQPTEPYMSTLTYNLGFLICPEYDIYGEVS